MTRDSGRSWSRWWWDVTIWGALIATTLVHALLYGWTDEHTLAVVPMGLWVGFALSRIQRGRSRGRRQTSDATPSNEAGQEPDGAKAISANRRTRNSILRAAALMGMAVMVFFILGRGNLNVPTTALGVWIAMELVRWQVRKDPHPPERHPPDPSLHDPTRRN